MKSETRQFFLSCERVDDGLRLLSCCGERPEDDANLLICELAAEPYSAVQKTTAANDKSGTDEVSVALPGFIDELPLRIIGTGAFSEFTEGIACVILPDTVREIEDEAFEFCIDLKEMVIPEGVQRLGRDLLVVSSVEKLHLPSTITEIRHPETLQCAVEVAEGNTSYASTERGFYHLLPNGDHQLVRAFVVEGQTQYDVEEGVTEIGITAFDGLDELREVALAASVHTVAEGAFSSVRDVFSSIGGIVKITVSAANPYFFTEGQALYRWLDAKNEIVGDRSHKRTALVRYMPSLDAEQNAVHSYVKQYEDKDHRVDDLRDDLCVIYRDAFLSCDVTELILPEQVEEIHEDAFLHCPLRVVRLCGKHTIIFPWENAFYRMKLLESFGKNDNLYNFQAYDRWLLQEPLNVRRGEMIAQRLGDPWLLDSSTQQAYMKKMEDGIPEILQDAAEKKAIHVVNQWIALGFLREDNADAWIEAAAAAVDKDFMVHLMNYKHEHFETAAFDFSL